MSLVTTLIWLVLRLWVLAGATILLDRLERRHFRQILYIFLGAMAALDAWRAPSADALAASSALGGDLPAFLLAPRVLAPVIYFAVLSIYLAEGTLTTALLILGLFGVSLLSGLGLPLSAVLGDIVGVPFATGPAALVKQIGIRQSTTEVFAFVLGLYVLVVLYQVIANRWPQKAWWLASSLALLVAGLAQAVLYTFGGFWGTPFWPEMLYAEALGWAVASAAISPLMAPHLRRVAQGGPGDPTLPRLDRPALGLLRETIALQSALEESRRRIAHLDESLSLLAEIRKLIVRATDQGQLMNQVTQFLVSSRRYVRAWIGHASGDEPSIRVMAEALSPGVSASRWEESPELQKHLELAWNEMQPVVVARAKSGAGPLAISTNEPEPSKDCFALIPMRLMDRAAGALAVYAPDPDALDPDEVRLLQAVADDLVHGLNRLNAEEQRVRRMQELEVIGKLTAQMSSQADLEILLERTVEWASTLLQGSGGGMYLTQPETGMLRCAVSYRSLRDQPGQELRFGEGTAGRVAQTRKPLIIHEGPTLADQAPSSIREASEAIASVPMIWQEEVKGVIHVIRTDPQRPFTPQDLDLLTLFANQAAMVLENARLIEAAERRVRQLSLLNALNRAALAASDLDSLVAVLPQRMAELIDADGCYITLWDEIGRRPVPAAAHGSRQEAFLATRVQEEEKTFTESALRLGRPLVVEDTFDKLYGSSRLAETLDASSLVALPLAVGEKWLGAALLSFARPRSFTAEEVAICEQAAGLASFSLAKAQAFLSEQRRGTVLETLRQASLQLTSHLELQPVLEAILDQALQLVSADDAHFFLYDGEELTFGAARWAAGVEFEPYRSLRRDGVTQAVAQTGERVVIPNVDDHPLFQDWKWGGAIVSLPLHFAGRVVGVMNIAFASPHLFAEEELQVLELLGDQAAVALQNAKLFQAVDTERQRVQVLNELARDLASSLDPDEILQRTVTLTTTALGGIAGEAFLLEPDNQLLRLRASARSDGLSLESVKPRFDRRVGEGLTGWVSQHREPILVPDLQADPRWSPAEGLDDEARSALVAPIHAGDLVLGTLAVFHAKPAAFQQDHLERLVAISRQVGLALSNAERYQQLERRLAELATLQQVAQVISRRLEMQPLLQEVVEQVWKVLGYPVVEIYLVEDDLLILRAARGLTEPLLLRLPFSRGVVGRVARTSEPAFVPDVLSDPDYLQGSVKSQVEIAVPLRKGDIVIGVLNVESPDPDSLTTDDVRLLSLLADQITVAIENASLYDRLRRHTEMLEQTVADRTAELAEALVQAQAADRLKTQFVADVSHELRTPLTNIRLYLELLTIGSPERYQDYLETLQRETDRLVTLIEDLLAISRLDAGTAMPQLAPLDLNKLAEGLVKDRQRLLAEKRLEVSFRSDVAVPMIVGDARMLSQVLANLMTNAMHYTLPGGSIRISTGLQSTGKESWVTLKVADSGLGIPEKELLLLFERFYRGSASRQLGVPGTGLGLAICKEILDRHGGRITVDSQVGKGSTFTVWLPVAAEAETTDTMPQESPASAP